MMKTSHYFKTSDHKEFKLTYKIKGSGVNLKQYNYTPEPEEGRIKVLLAARMIVEKGIFILTDAAMKLKGQYQNKSSVFCVVDLMITLWLSKKVN
ncbi:hypothetical protein NXW84_12365 [Bacteroides fragilis]|nr:hypothetical protein NXW84_12365 [Bacteroides fragilis]